MFLLISSFSAILLKSLGKKGVAAPDEMANTCLLRLTTSFKYSSSVPEAKGHVNIFEVISRYATYSVKAKKSIQWHREGYRPLDILVFPNCCIVLEVEDVCYEQSPPCLSRNGCVSTATKS